jgi:GNAT superfamily N-acetyltransferase
MTAFDIQLASPQTDYDFIGRLLTEWQEYPTSADDLMEEDAMKIEGRLRKWWVATGPDRCQVGVAHAAHYPSQPADRFHAYIITDPEHRRRGVGHDLYQHLLAFLQDSGATDWRCRINEADADSLGFAQNRGFDIEVHSFESRLDLTTFDESPFVDAYESLGAEGIRFVPFDSLTDNPQAGHKLYDLNRLAGLDEPATSSFASFETRRQIVLDAAWFHHDCEFVALDVDRYVGLCGAFPAGRPGV